MPGNHGLLDFADVLAQCLEKLNGIVLGFRHRPDRRDRVEYALQGYRIQGDDIR